MKEEKYKARDVQPTALRLHPEVRGELVRLALRNGRSLSKEIAVRLQASLEQEKAPPPAPLALRRENQTGVDTNGGAYSVQVETTETERAMLAVFRSLPPEKQLALLSLFK